MQNTKYILMKASRAVRWDELAELSKLKHGKFEILLFTNFRVHVSMNVMNWVKINSEFIFSHKTMLISSFVCKRVTDHMWAVLVNWNILKNILFTSLLSFHAMMKITGNFSNSWFPQQTPKKLFENIRSWIEALQKTETFNFSTPPTV